jgi:hypothetical protein
MAASTLRAIMLGIETRLETITGLRASNISPDSIDVPSGGGYAVVGAPDVDDYHATMGNGRVSLSPAVTVLVSSSSGRAGQLLLADYADFAGAKSVRAAIEADKTLGGAVEDCIVTSFAVLGLVRATPSSQLEYLGGRFALSIIGRGA